MLGNKATVTKNALISLASHKLPFGCYVLIQQPTVAGPQEYQVRTARVRMLPQGGSMPPLWLLGIAAQFPPPLKRGDFLPGQEQNLLHIPLKLTFPSMEEAQSMAAALNPPLKKPLSESPCGHPSHTVGCTCAPLPAPGEAAAHPQVQPTQWLRQHRLPLGKPSHSPRKQHTNQVR